jgi:hypothetical protein
MGKQRRASVKQWLRAEARKNLVGNALAAIAVTVSVAALVVSSR